MAGALTLSKEAEQICRQMNDNYGLAISLVSQAEALEQMGRPQEGLPLAEEAHQIAASHGDASLAGQIEPLLKTLRQAAQS